MGYIIEHESVHHCPGRLVHHFISSECHWLAEIDRETGRSTAANENGAPRMLATASLGLVWVISLELLGMTLALQNPSDNSLRSNS